MVTEPEPYALDATSRCKLPTAHLQSSQLKRMPGRKVQSRSRSHIGHLAAGGEAPPTTGRTLSAATPVDPSSLHNPKYSSSQRYLPLVHKTDRARGYPMLQRYLSNRATQ